MTDALDYYTEMLGAFAGQNIDDKVLEQFDSGFAALLKNLSSQTGVAVADLITDAVADIATGPAGPDGPQGAPGPVGPASDYIGLAKSPDAIVSGLIVRDDDGLVSSATVIWPNGDPGVFTVDSVNDSPAAINGYHITQGDPVTLTYTQPTITRDVDGNATTIPAIVVS